ncbi:MAG: formyltransferase family protein, partial [Acidimicrobiales bacterium]|nr:formyltransferase family protein [Acidimicrobiales bacterium]
DRFPNRVINLHPALPGVFPGAHAIDDAWVAHETEGLDHTGVMVHLVPDEGVDNGPVLASQRVDIAPDDSRESLEAKVHAVEHELFLDAIADYLRGQ